MPILDLRAMEWHLDASRLRISVDVNPFLCLRACAFQCKEQKETERMFYKVLYPVRNHNAHNQIFKMSILF